MGKLTVEKYLMLSMSGMMLTGLQESVESRILRCKDVFVWASHSVSYYSITMKQIMGRERMGTLQVDRYAMFTQMVSRSIFVPSNRKAIPRTPLAYCKLEISVVVGGQRNPWIAMTFFFHVSGYGLIVTIPRPKTNFRWKRYYFQRDYDPRIRSKEYILNSPDQPQEAR